MKKTALIVSLVCLALLLSACTGESRPAAQATQEPLSCAAYADRVQQAVSGAAMADVNEKYLEKTLLIQASALSDWVFRRDGEGATPEMILVLQVRDASDLETVKKAVQEYLDERTLQYRDYQPEQLPKLENAKVLAKGGMVALCVTPDAEKARSALGDGWK